MIAITASLCHIPISWFYPINFFLCLVLHLVYVRVCSSTADSCSICYYVYSRAYLSCLVYTYLFILISTALCSILLVRNEISYQSIVFFPITLKLTGRLFPVDLKFSSLISLEAFWVSVECISSFLLATPLQCMPHPPRLLVGGDFEGGLTPAACPLEGAFAWFFYCTFTHIYV